MSEQGDILLTNIFRVPTDHQIRDKLLIFFNQRAELSNQIFNSTMNCPTNDHDDDDDNEIYLRIVSKFLNSLSLQSISTDVILDLMQACNVADNIDMLIQTMQKLISRSAWGCFIEMSSYVLSIITTTTTTTTITGVTAMQKFSSSKFLFLSNYLNIEYFIADDERNDFRLLRNLIVIEQWWWTQIGRIDNKVITTFIEDILLKHSVSSNEDDDCYLSDLSTSMRRVYRIFDMFWTGGYMGRDIRQLQNVNSLFMKWFQKPFEIEEEDEEDEQQEEQRDMDILVRHGDFLCVNILKIEDDENKKKLPTFLSVLISQYVMYTKFSLIHTVIENVLSCDKVGRILTANEYLVIYDQICKNCGNFVYLTELYLSLDLLAADRWVSRPSVSEGIDDNNYNNVLLLPLTKYIGGALCKFPEDCGVLGQNLVLNLNIWMEKYPNKFNLTPSGNLPLLNAIKYGNLVLFKYLLLEAHAPVTTTCHELVFQIMSDNLDGVVDIHSVVLSMYKTISKYIILIIFKNMERNQQNKLSKEQADKLKTMLQTLA